MAKDDKAPSDFTAEVVGTELGMAVEELVRGVSEEVASRSLDDSMAGYGGMKRIEDAKAKIIEVVRRIMKGG